MGFYLLFQKEDPLRNLLANSLGVWETYGYVPKLGVLQQSLGLLVLGLGLLHLGLRLFVFGPELLHLSL